MQQTVAHGALVVDDCEEAIELFSEKVGFILLDDTPQSELV